MKKIIFILFTLTLCLFVISNSKTTIKAESSNNGDLAYSNTELYEDGSYLVIKIYSETQSNLARSESYTKTHTKEITYYTASDQLVWEYKLYAHFTVVEGESCQAHRASYSENIHRPAWSFSDGSASFRGNIVYGTGTFKHKLLGITTKTMEIDTQIICDEYGNISY